MMKGRNYLLVLLSLTLTGMPAYAVDYLNCREMLRTKNEFAKKLSASTVARIESCGQTKEEIENHLEKDKQVIKLRAQVKQSEEKFMSDQRVTNEEGKQVPNERLTSDDISEIVDKFRQTQQKLGLEIAKRRHLVMFNLYVGVHYCMGITINSKDLNYNANENYWYKKVLRVKEDMKKANCPY